jgi:hypothetical protein
MYSRQLNRAWPKAQAQWQLPAANRTKKPIPRLLHEGSVALCCGVFAAGLTPEIDQNSPKQT